MGILWLFDTCGFIIGPAIVVAGFLAVLLCLRASGASSTRKDRWRALIAAASPVAVGVVGVVFGLIVWWANGAAGAPWAALGKVCLAGVVVAAVPLVWAAILLRSRQNPVGGQA